MTLLKKYSKHEIISSIGCRENKTCSKTFHIHASNDSQRRLFTFSDIFRPHDLLPPSDFCSYFPCTEIELSFSIQAHQLVPRLPEYLLIFPTTNMQIRLPVVVHELERLARSTDGTTTYMFARNLADSAPDKLCINGMLNSRFASYRRKLTFFKAVVEAHVRSIVQCTRISLSTSQHHYWHTVVAPHQCVRSHPKIRRSSLYKPHCITAEKGIRSGTCGIMKVDAGLLG